MTRCATCGDELPADRTEWGYEYCVKPACVEKNFTGVRLVEVAVNKSAAQLVAADDVDEALEKTRNGEYAKKDTTLGAGSQPQRRSAPETPTRKRRIAPAAGPARRKRWTPQQEKIVRVYNEMGMRPQEMIERAPHLNLSVELITEIVCSIKR